MTILQLGCGCAPQYVQIPAPKTKPKQTLIQVQKKKSYKKTMSAKQATSFCKKLLKWHRGEIDEWDAKNRTPSPSEVTRFYESCLIGLDYLSRNNVDIVATLLK